MIKLNAYKHETGKIFYNLEEYKNFDKGYQQKQQAIANRKKNYARYNKEKKDLQQKMSEIRKEEKQRVARRRLYVESKVRPIVQTIEDMQTQIKKLRKAIVITNASIKSHKADYTKEFNKDVEPSKAKSLGPLNSRYSGLNYKLRRL